MLGSLGSAIAGIALNLAATAAVSLVLKGISVFLDDIIQTESEIIEKGQEAHEVIQDLKDEFSEKKNGISSLATDVTGEGASFKNTDKELDSIAKKYAELSKGVNSYTNENVSLSTDEYQEYLDICNQLADVFPSLSTATDAQGNAILNLGQDAETASGQLKELLDGERALAKIQYKEQLSADIDGSMTQIEQYREEKDTLESEYSNLLSGIADLKERGTLYDSSTDKIRIPNYKDVSEEYMEQIDQFINDYGLGLWENRASGEEGEIGTLINLSEEEKAKVIAEIDSFYSGIMNSLSAKAYELGTEIAAEDANITNEAQKVLSDISGILEYDKTFSELPLILQNSFLSAIQNTNVENLLSAGYEDEDFENYIEQKYITPIRKLTPAMQTALQDLFNTDPSDMTLSEYNDYVFKTLRDTGFDSLFEELGFTDYFVDLYKKTQVIKDAVEGDDGLIDALSIEDRKIAYDLVVNDNFSGTFDALQRQIQQFKDVTNAEKNNWSSILSNTDEGSLSEAIDNYQDAISKIQTAQENLKNGELKGSTLTDLQQEFPELINQTDDLSAALNNLSADKASEVISSIRSAMKDMTDPDELAGGESLIRGILDTLDFSDVDVDTVREQIAKIFEPDTDDPRSETIALHKISDFYSEFDQEMQTEKGREIILTLMADPANAELTIEQFREKYNEEEIIYDFKIRDENISKLENELKEIQDEASYAQKEMSLKEAQGKSLTETDYNNSISLANKEIAKYRELIEEQKGLQEAIVKHGGSKTSDSYIEAEQNIRSYQSSIIDLQTSQAEWEESIRNLPLDELSNKLTGLEEEAQAVQDAMSLKEAKGIKSSVSDYKKLINNSKLQVQTLQKQNAELQKQLVGLNETDSKYQEIQSQINSNLSSINAARISQLEWNEAAAQLNYEPGEGLTAYNKAKETRNAGDNYLDIQSALNEAKEAWDDGLVGTDDFQEVARMISPSGAIDADNFLENYNKLSSWFTDGTEGAKKFLNSLDSKGLAKFNEETQSWMWNIENMSDAANKMGTTEEVMTAMFGRLQDYGFDNNYVSSVEDGIQRLSKLYKELAEEESLLKEMQSNPSDYTEEQIRSKQGSIASIKSNISGTKTAMENVAVAAAEEANAEIENAKFAITSFAKERKNILDNNIYGENSEEIARQMEEQIISYIEDNNLDVDLNKLYSAIDDAYKNTGTWENPIQSFEPKDSKEMEAYKTAWKSVMQAHQEGNTVLEETSEILTGLSYEDLKNIDFSDGQYTEGLESAEKALDSLAKALDIDNPQMLLEVLKAVGVLDTDVDLSDLEILGEKDVQSGLGELERLQKAGAIDASIDFNADTSSMDIDQLQERLSSLEEIQIQLSPDSDSYNTIQKLIEDTQVQLKIQTVISDSGYSVEELKEMDGQTIDTVFNLGGDTDKIEQIQNAIQSLDSGFDVTVKIADEQFNQLVEEEKTVTVNSSSADEAQSKLDKINETKLNNKVFHISSNTSTQVSFVNSLISALDKLNGKNSVYTITKNVVSNKEAEADGSFASGTLIPAHASGTAFNMLNLTPAYANGRGVSLEHDEKALVNEMGTEGLIRGGKLYEIPGGMHYQALKKGDIVLSVSQMKQLSLTGKASGHGKAYANGTLGSTPLMNAYGGGSSTGGGNFSGGASTSTNSDTSKNTTATNNNTKAQNNNTSATKGTTKSLEDFQKWTEKIKDWIEVKLQRLQESIDLNTAKAENAVGYSAKNKNIDSALTSARKMETDNESAVKEYESQLTKITSNAVSAKLLNGKTDSQRQSRANDIIKKIENGTIKINEYDEKEREFIETYSEWYQKIVDCKQAIEEAKQTQKELAQTKLDNITEQYDAMLSHIEHSADMINGYMEQAEFKGYADSTKYYEGLKTQSETSIKKMEEERAALVSSLQTSLEKGDITEGSVEWYNMQTQINEVSKSIQDANTQILEYNNSIQQIEWDRFEKQRESVARLTEEADFLIDLMSDEDLFDDKGNMTDAGLATAGLHGQNYNVYMEQANEYAAAAEKIKKQMANEPWNTKLINQYNEYIDKQKESILAAEDEKEAIKDLVQDGIDKELDALDELIDKYTEALDSQKDLNDYQKNVGDKSKEVTRLEKQLKAYENDDSEEGKSKRQKLQAQLDEAREDLEETEYDRYISDQKDLLSNLQEEYSNVLNKRLDDIDDLIKSMTEKINDSSSDISKTLEDQASSVGYTMSEELKAIWGDNGSGTKALSNYSTNFSATMTTVQSSIDGILGKLDTLVSLSDQNASEGVSSSTGDTEANPQTGKGTKAAGGNSQSGSTTGNSTQEKDPKILAIINKGKTGKKYIAEQRKKKNHSKLWTHIVDTYGHVPTYAIYKELGKYLGVKAPKGYTVSSETNALLKALNKKGYASGTSNVPKEDNYWTNEEGQEYIIRKSDGAMLQRLFPGDKVLNAQSSDNIYNFAANPQKFVDGLNIGNIPASSLSNSTTIGDTTVNISLPNVLNYEDFVYQLQHDKKFEGMVQSMTIGRINGKSSLNKYKTKF